MLSFISDSLTDSVGKNLFVLFVRLPNNNRIVRLSGVCTSIEPNTWNVASSILLLNQIAMSENIHVTGGPNHRSIQE